VGFVPSVVGDTPTQTGETVGDFSNWPKVIVVRLISSLLIITEEISDGDDDWQSRPASVVIPLLTSF